MAVEFTTNAGETVARELLIAYLNVATYESPKWAPIGKRVEDSSEEMDWGGETKNDILGQTYTTLKKPTITQTFDPCELDSGDEAQQKLWQLAVVEQNAQALANQDMLIVHLYASSDGKPFAERYDSCAITPTSLGGEGGGNVGMPIDVTYGGKRTVGTVDGTGENITFKEDAVSTLSASPLVIKNRNAVTEED